MSRRTSKSFGRTHMAWLALIGALFGALIFAGGEVRLGRFGLMTASTDKGAGSGASSSAPKPESEDDKHAKASRG